MDGEDLAFFMQNPERVRRAFDFLEAMMSLRVLTSAGDQPLQFSPGATNCVLDLRAITGTGVVADSPLPEPTTDGQIMISDGTEPEWYPPDEA